MQLLELGERLVVRRVDLEDLLPRGRRACPAPAPVSRQSCGDLRYSSIFCAGVFERGGALHLDVDDVGPALFGAVDRLERGHRLEVGADLEELAPRVGRVERLAELLAVGLAELAEDLHELVGVEQRRGAVDRLVERVDELAAGRARRQMSAMARSAATFAKSMSRTRFQSSSAESSRLSCSVKSARARERMFDALVVSVAMS